MVVNLRDIDHDGLNGSKLSTPSGCFLLCVLAILLFIKQVKTEIEKL
jgi:hypothetical protein